MKNTILYNHTYNIKFNGFFSVLCNPIIKRFQARQRRNSKPENVTLPANVMVGQKY